MDATSSDNTKYQDNATQQAVLLGALAKTQDPQKLKEIIGVRTVAEVYRTLDKLQIRKEFHKALDKNGISFDFIISGIKKEAIGGDKSADRLKAFDMMLKTLGLDKYDDSKESSSTSWEEKLIEAMDAAPAIPNKEEVLHLQGEGTDVPNTIFTPMEEYEVEVPQIPLSAKAKEAEEKKMGDSLMSHDYPKPKS